LKNTAVELINNASTNNHTNDEEYIELAKQALKFLRIKAAKVQ